MVRCLVIGVGVGRGTATGAGTDDSEINLSTMTLFELRRLRRKYESPLRYREDGSAVVYFLTMDQHWYTF
jgi:hypothetical protein